MKITPVRKSTVFALSFGTAAFVLFGCGTTGKTVDGSDVDLVLPFEKPSDSTGAQSDVALSFGMLDSTSALMLETPVTPAVITVDDKIEVSVARVSIAGIKIKSAKDPSGKEKEHDKELMKKMKDRNTKEETEDTVAEEAVVKEEKAGELSLMPAEKPKAKPTKEDFQKNRQDHKKAAADERKTKDIAEIEDEGKADDSLKWKGPFVYDVVKKTSTPEFSTVKIPDGSYRRIDVLLKPNRTVESTDGLLNNSIYIGGTVLLNGAKVPFKISYHMADHMRLGGSSDAAAVKLEANLESKLVIAFDVKSWFAGVDLTTAAQTNGVIIIDKSTNKDVLKMIHKNIQGAMHFGKGSAKGALKASEAKGNGKAAAEADAAAG